MSPENQHIISVLKFVKTTKLCTWVGDSATNINETIKEEMAFFSVECAEHNNF